MVLHGGASHPAAKQDHRAGLIHHLHFAHDGLLHQREIQPLIDQRRAIAGSEI